MPDFPQNPYLNQIVTWQGSDYRWNGRQWINLSNPDPTTVPVYISASPPAPPLLQGSLWYDTVNHELYIWVLELGENQWVPVSGTTEPCPYVYVSVSPPSDAINGTLWYQPHTFTLSIYVVAITGNEWRVIASNSPTPQPPCVIVSASPPLDPTLGHLWYKTTNHSLYVWVVTLSGSSWELISSSNATVKPTVYVSAPPPQNPVQGDLWLNPSTRILRVWNIFLNSGSWLETYPCDLLTAAASAAESAEQAAASAEIAQYYAQQAAQPLGSVLIDSTQTGIIYVGKAPAGSLETAQVWTIYRSIFDYTGNLTSSGTATNVAWTDRYTIPYS